MFLAADAFGNCTVPPSITRPLHGTERSARFCIVLLTSFPGPRASCES